MKKILLKIFDINEVNNIFNIIGELEKRFDDQAFKTVMYHFNEFVILNSNKIEQVVPKGISFQAFTYGTLCNISGDLLESGNYHLYRGLLNPLGPGEELLKIFDESLEALEKNKIITMDLVKEQKLALRKNIENMG